LIISLGLIVASPLAAQTSDVGAARARWADASAASYEYGYHKFCECHGDTPPETLVSVTDGNVVNVRHKPAGSDIEVPAAERNFQYYWTIDGLFDLIQSAIARDATVRVRFDPTLGYPTSVFIDYSENLIGDEVDVRITQLRML
jgi:hypothetical protein